MTPNHTPSQSDEATLTTRVRRFTLLLLVLLPCLLYGHTLRFEPVLDDETYVLSNPLLRSHQSFYYPWQFHTFANSGSDLGLSRDMTLNFITRPVTYLSFYANRVFNGTETAGYRMVNIFIHLSNGLLLFLLLEKLLQKNLKSTVAAALAALLFAAHPMATESVTYITQRFESLSTMFCLIAVLGYCLHRHALTRWGQTLHLSVSLIATLLSMLSKETGFVVPLIILAVEYWGFQSTLRSTLKRTWKHLLLMPLLPFLIVATDLAQTGMRPTLSSVLNITNHVEDGHNTLTYFLTQISAWLTYLRLWLLPVGQNFDHDYPKITSALQPAFIAALSGVLTIAGCLWMLYRRHQEKAALLVIGALWFWVSLTPSSSIFALPDLFSEHRSYFPALGLFVAVAAGLSKLLEFQHRQLFKTAVLVLYPIILISLSLTTLLRNEVLRTRENVWKDSLAKGSNTARVWKGLGIASHQQGRPQEAIECFKKAVAVRPQDLEAWYNLNTAYLKMGMNQEALESTQNSLQFLGANTQLLHLRALAFVNAGYPDEGQKIWTLILQHTPGNRDANVCLGEFYAKMGRYEEALYHLSEAEKTGPLSPYMMEIKRKLQAQLSTMR